VTAFHASVAARAALGPNPHMTHPLTAANRPGLLCGPAACNCHAAAGFVQWCTLMRCTAENHLQNHCGCSLAAWFLASALLAGPPSLLSCSAWSALCCTSSLCVAQAAWLAPLKGVERVCGSMMQPTDCCQGRQSGLLPVDAAIAAAWQCMNAPASLAGTAVLHQSTQPTCLSVATRVLSPD